MSGPCRDKTLFEIVRELPERHGAGEQWARIYGVLSDLASRECEAPGECGETSPWCLPCRARGAIGPPPVYWVRDDIERRLGELGDRGFAAEYQMDPGVGAVALCRKCRAPAGVLNAEGWMRRSGDMGWTRVMAEDFSAKCAACCAADGEAWPALRYEGAKPGFVEFDGCPLTQMEGE